MKNLTIYQKMTIWLAGHDIERARECTSSEITTMEHIGLMVLIVPVIGLFSYTYAINYYVRNLMLAIPIGIVLSLVVMIIDRALVGYSRSKFTIGMIGRLFLILGFAFTLSEPILVGAFQSSIREQLSNNIIHAQREAAVPYTSRINELQGKIEDGQERLYNLQKAYTEEMDGTGGSGQRHKGPIYRQKKQDYEAYKNSFTAKKEDLKAKIATVNSARTVAMKQAKENKAVGLIAAIRALHDLGEKESIVKYGSWILRLVLVFIELCPMLIKISPTGSIGLYYQLVDLFDKERLEEVECLKGLRIKEAKEKKALALIISFFEAKAKKLDRIAKGEIASAELRMKHVTEMAETSKNYKQKLGKLIQDKTLLEKLHTQVDEIFDEFVRAVNDLGDDPSDLSFNSPQA